MRRNSYQRNQRRVQRVDAPALRVRLARGLRRLMLVAILACLMVGGWFFYQSPLLQVRDVSVVGAQTLDANTLAAASGLKGQNIIGADTGSAEERLLALAMVKSVSISRRWPGKMVVHVEERQPWGYWRIGDQPYVIDDEGVVLDGTRPDEGAPTIVESDSVRRLAPGDRLDADTVSLARQLIDASPRALKRDVTGLEFSEHSGLTVVFSGGLRATFGDSRDLDYKLSVLYVLLEKAQAQSFAVHSVDLRFGENVSFQ